MIKLKNLEKCGLLVGFYVSLIFCHQKSFAKTCYPMNDFWISQMYLDKSGKDKSYILSRVGPSSINMYDKYQGELDILTRNLQLLSWTPECTQVTNSSINASWNVKPQKGCRIDVGYYSGGSANDPQYRCFYRYLN
jgi:hypothetical protein